MVNERVKGARTVLYLKQVSKCIPQHALQERKSKRWPFTWHHKSLIYHQPPNIEKIITSFQESHVQNNQIYFDDSFNTWVQVGQLQRITFCRCLFIAKCVFPVQLLQVLAHLSSLRGFFCSPFCRGDIPNKYNPSKILTLHFMFSITVLTNVQV